MSKLKEKDDREFSKQAGEWRGVSPDNKWCETMQKRLREESLPLSAAAPQVLLPRREGEAVCKDVR